MPRRISVYVWVVLLLAAGAVVAGVDRAAAERSAGPWPQWRGPQRNGLSSETGINTDWEKNPPELLWMSEGLGSGFAGVSVAGGKLFTTGNVSDGQAAIAASLEDGRVLWSTTLTDAVPKHGHEGSRCTPTVDGDRLYVVTSDGAVACLQTTDGKVVWKRKFEEWNGRMMSGWGYSESPLVDGDWLLCTPGGQDAMIVALDKQNGKEVWRTAMPDYGQERGRNDKPLKDGAGYSSIVISHGGGVKQYVQLVGRGVIGVRASDGKLLWRYREVSNGTANVPTPVIDGDYVFCSSGYQTGSALLKLVPSGDGVDAKEVYFLDAKTLQNHHGGMLLVGKHIYTGHAHNSGFPICVELASGKVAWGGRRGPGSGSAAVTYVDGHIIFRYQSGEVALIEATPEALRMKGVFKPAFQKGKTWAHPVVADGRLYLREQEKLMCYRLK